MALSEPQQLEEAKEILDMIGRDIGIVNKILIDIPKDRYARFTLERACFLDKVLSDIYNLTRPIGHAQKTFWEAIADEEVTSWIHRLYSHIMAVRHEFYQICVGSDASVDRFFAIAVDNIAQLDKYVGYIKTTLDKIDPSTLHQGDTQ